MTISLFKGFWVIHTHAVLSLASEVIYIFTYRVDAVTRDSYNRQGIVACCAEESPLLQCLYRYIFGLSHRLAKIRLYLDLNVSDGFSLSLFMEAEREDLGFSEFEFQFDLPPYVALQ